MRKVRDWMSVALPFSFQWRKRAIFTLQSLAPSSLTLNQKEEVEHERQVEVKNLAGHKNGNALLNSLFLRYRRLQLSQIRHDCGWTSNKGKMDVVLYITKKLLGVWETLVGCDGLLALPAKVLCVVILGLIVFSPYIIYVWCLNIALSVGAPLCYLLYILFLFYVATLLIVGSVIGYLREGS